MASNAAIAVTATIAAPITSTDSQSTTSSTMAQRNRPAQAGKVATVPCSKSAATSRVSNFQYNFDNSIKQPKRPLLEKLLKTGTAPPAAMETAPTVRPDKSSTPDDFSVETIPTLSIAKSSSANVTAPGGPKPVNIPSALESTSVSPGQHKHSTASHSPTPATATPPVQSVTAITKLMSPAGTVACTGTSRASLSTLPTPIRATASTLTPTPVSTNKGQTHLQQPPPTPSTGTPRQVAEIRNIMSQSTATTTTSTLPAPTTTATIVDTLKPPSASNSTLHPPPPAGVRPESVAENGKILPESPASKVTESSESPILDVTTAATPAPDESSRPTVIDNETEDTPVDVETISKCGKGATKCSLACFQPDVTQLISNERMIGILQKPLIYGWKRENIGEKPATVIYTAPCGRKFENSEVDLLNQELWAVNCTKLRLENFSFNAEIKVGIPKSSENIRADIGTMANRWMMIFGGFLKKKNSNRLGRKQLTADLARIDSGEKLWTENGENYNFEFDGGKEPSDVPYFYFKRDYKAEKGPRKTHCPDPDGKYINPLRTG